MLREGREDAPGATAGAAADDPVSPGQAGDDSDIDDADFDDDDMADGPLDVDLAATAQRRVNLPALPRRRSRGLAFGWLALALVVLSLVGGAWFGRTWVIATWPAAASLYGAAGVAAPVVGAGLELRDVTATRTGATEATDGEELVITGLIANVSDNVVDVPWLRGSLRGPGGAEVRAWTFRPETGRLLPGETVTFETRTPAPSDEARDLAIIFVLTPS
ncbi:MAG: DUF3426 domain-containing protein [Alphaproteobacteria bacterium]